MWKQKASKGKGDGDFEKPPPGNHLARLIGMFDLGTQENEYQGNITEQHRVYWVWELLNEKQSGTKGINHVIGIELTLSLNEKAKMRKFIEARTGKSIPDGSEYDIASELGQPCLLNVVMVKEYPKVDGVSAVPKGMEAPKSQREPSAITLDQIRAGEVIPDWAPYIYGEPPMDVVGRCLEFKNEPITHNNHGADARNGADSTRKGPPPRKQANYYLDPGDDTEPPLLPMNRLKELVAEKGKLAFSWKVCPENGQEWKPLVEAIPEAANWSPF